MCLHNFFFFGYTSTKLLRRQAKIELAWLQQSFPASDHTSAKEAEAEAETGTAKEAGAVRPLKALEMPNVAIEVVAESDIAASASLRPIGAKP